MEIQHLAEDFYVLQALGATAHVEPFRHSHQRWRKDYQEYVQTFNQKFAVTLYDYLCLITFGEARHASELATYYYPDWPVDRNDSRDAAYNLATDYSPDNFLPKAIRLFRGAKWHPDYGGESWAAIAEAALMYGKVPDVVFIDHALDLSHNSGLCFDKTEARIFKCRSKYTYREFLDTKAKLDPDEYIPELGCSCYAVNLAKRAYNLGIANFPPPQVDAEHMETVKTLLDREPIRWGSYTIDAEMALSEVTCDGCGKTVSKKDTIDVDDAVLCLTCYNNQKEDGYEEDDDVLCLTCYNNQKEDGYEEDEEEGYGEEWCGDYAAATCEDGRGSASAA